MYVVPLDQTFLVDIFVLKDLAFTLSHNDISLQSLCESDKVVKVFFDVRSDSDALFNYYGISLNNTVDLQMMAYFQPTHPPRRALKSLAYCIEQDAGLSDGLVGEWKLTKDAGKAFFKSADMDLFRRRPLSNALIQYYVGDVEHMAVLYDTYKAHLPSRDWQDVLYETQARIKQSQKPSFDQDRSERWKGPSRHRDRGRPHQQKKPVQERKSATGKGGKHREPQLREPNQPPLDELMSRCAIHEGGSSKPGALHDPGSVGVDGGAQGQLRHRPLRFVAGGRPPESKENAGRRRAIKRSQPRSRRYEEDLDHSLCDKDCGWCGHCSRSMFT